MLPDEISAKKARVTSTNPSIIPPTSMMIFINFFLKLLYFHFMLNTLKCYNL